MNSLRFYCPNCNRLIDRRFVTPKAYEEGFKCKWCGERVLNANKIKADMMKDFLEYAEKRGVDIDIYE